MGAIRFDNSYARLPEHFYARVQPAGAKSPQLLALNVALAKDLGLDADWLASPKGVAFLAGNEIAEGADPIAQAYSGHQFGGFSPQLGDGRAILLGEVLDSEGKRRDIQLKGSGRTPWSRGGDGLAAIGPVLREYIISEAMHALGVPTTRSLAAIATGETVYRETPLPGAVLTRIAASHIRVGTFQYFFARDDIAGLRTLADHVIARHYPEGATAENPYAALLSAVIGRQARLIAQWMNIGFIHGVMNTDNMTVSGETIDYGPCAFMDRFDPAQVYSSIDTQGRYAYRNQPSIGQWNLANFAQTLVPLLDDDADKAVDIAQESLNGYASVFGEAMLSGLRAKLGLSKAEQGDMALAQDFLKQLHTGEADFTNAFRALSFLSREETEADALFFANFVETGAVQMWLLAWRSRLQRETHSDDERQSAMRAVNPAYIPRNHLVEEALSAAQAGDLAPFELLNRVLADPFREQPGMERHAQPPKPEEEVLATFCGT